MNHIVQVKDNNDRISHVRVPSKYCWDKPVVVMVNRVWLQHLRFCRSNARLRSWYRRW